MHTRQKQAGYGCLISKYQLNEMVTSRRRTLHLTTNKNLLIVHDAEQFLLEEDWEEMKLNELGGRKIIGQAEFLVVGEVCRAIF